MQQHPRYSGKTQQTHAIAALAKRQRGFVTRRQLLALGLRSNAIDRRIARGHLIREYAGVYAVGHVPVSFVDRAAAAVLACGPDAVLSHGSAASLWGLRKDWARPFEVTVPTCRRPRGITVHRSKALTRKDFRKHLGIRVTSPARTLLDCAPRLDARRLTRAVNDLRLSGHLNLTDLAELLGRTNGRRDTARLRAFTETPTGPTRSQFEDEFVRFARRHGLPTPQVNATVAGYEVDALFAAERVIVELDGYDFHSSKASFERDRERDAATLAAGFSTVRITWDRMTNSGAREAERLRTILRTSRAA